MASSPPNVEDTNMDACAIRKVTSRMCEKKLGQNMVCKDVLRTFRYCPGRYPEELVTKDGKEEWVPQQGGLQVSFSDVLDDFRQARSEAFGNTDFHDPFHDIFRDSSQDFFKIFLRDTRDPFVSPQLPLDFPSQADKGRRFPSSRSAPRPSQGSDPTKDAKCVYSSK